MRKKSIVLRVLLPLIAVLMAVLAAVFSLATHVWRSGSKKDNPYVLPGFNDVGVTFRSEGIMDDLFAKAVYLDDNTGRGGILYAVVDCFGLTNTDVNEIRALAWEWAQEAGVRSIQIAATHTHAGIDTVGTGNIIFGGKVPAFQRFGEFHIHPGP